RADRRQKGIVMFEKVEVPVLGIVENMSMHICSNAAGHRADRRQKGIVMFEKVEVPVLGIVENMSMHICSN
ncbi:hypothetical protein CQA61_30220, partial [Klebsiella pneumoniae]